jgi:hypothetical protein
VAGLGVGCVLLLLAARVGWGWEAKRRFDAAIAGYRAAGQPVTIPDFEALRPDLADEGNGAYHLRQAQQHMAKWGDGRPAQRHILGQLLVDPALRRELQPQIATFLETNAGALEDVRRARGAAQANWAVAFTSPLTQVHLPDLEEQRVLSHVLALATLYAHEHGDDAAAVERARDALAQARHVGDCFPSLLVNLYAVSMEVAAFRSIEAVVPNLQVGAAPHDAPPSARPATIEQVRALILSLTDEEELNRRWTRAAYGERLIQIDGTERMCTGRLTLLGTGTTSTWFDKAMQAVLSPAWRLDGIRMMRITTIAVEAGLLESWPLAGALLSDALESRQPDRGRALASLPSNVLLPALERAVALQHRRRAEGRMAATALALRLYEVRHGGRLDTLDALVPTYLPAVPRDPFDPTDGPIRYKSNGPTPMLYSVNEDGVDDGGRFSFVNGRMRESEQDLPFFLAGDRPVPPRVDPLSGESRLDGLVPASTQAAPHEQSVAPPREQHGQEP